MSGDRVPGGARTGEETRPGRRPEERTAAPFGPGGRWTVFVAIVGALVVPTLLWAAAPVVVPFVRLTAGRKVCVSGGLVVAAEAVFPTRPLLAGREVVRRYRRLLDPRDWFGRSRER